MKIGCLGLALLIIQGCGGNGGGAGAGGVGAGTAGMAGTAGTTGPDPASFNVLYNALFAPRCSMPTCHGGNAGGLDLSGQEAAYLDLVNAPSTGPICTTTGLSRVVPGDPDASLLVQKLGDPPPCGSRMPLSGMLPEADVANIRSWIATGALDN